MVLSVGAFRQIGRYRGRQAIGPLLGHVVAANGDRFPFLSVLFSPYEAQANHHGIGQFILGGIRMAGGGVTDLLGGIGINLETSPQTPIEEGCFQQLQGGDRPVEAEETLGRPCWLWTPASGRPDGPYWVPAAR